MLIVIEGLDRTGKTTLARGLADRYKLEYRHFDKPEQHPLDEYVRPIERPVRAVFDRYHVGESVWPEIFKRSSEFDATMMLYVDLVLRARGAVLVHAVRDVYEIIYACRVDEEPIDDRQVLLASTLFRNRVHSSAALLPAIEWSLGDHAAQEHVIKQAKIRWARAERVNDVTHRWIGNEEPDVLLVGDQVGPGSNGWTLPFVPYGNTSGHFLFSELRRDVKFTRNIAVCNSLQPDGSPEKVRELWEAMECPDVIALGNQAHAQLARDGFGSVPVVPHPQYVRRFLRRNGAGWYLREIKEASDAA